MAMRIQTSLQFDDKELFENFIIPYKEGRMLNKLILRCLSAYYYNQEVQDLVEGRNKEGLSDSTKESQSICDNIRASLMMQDFLASKLQKSFDCGLEDIDNILDNSEPKNKESQPVVEDKNQSGVVPITKEDVQHCLDSLVDSAKAYNNSITNIVNCIDTMFEYQDSLETTIKELQEQTSHLPPLDTACIVSAEKKQNLIAIRELIDDFLESSIDCAEDIL